MSISSSEKTWQKLYTAAVFETDKSKIAERIAHAEQAIAVRARSLFAAGASAERSALDSAYYALNVLKFYAGLNTANEAMPVLQNASWAETESAQKIKPS